MRIKLYYYFVILFWLVDDFKMVFKELIYMDLMLFVYNVIEFLENGSDSMKKEVNLIFLYWLVVFCVLRNNFIGNNFVIKKCRVWD